MRRGEGMVENIIKIGSVAGALTSILAVILFFFPQLRPTVPTSKAVTISGVRVENVSPRSSDQDNCLAAVSLKVQISGYNNTILSLSERLDRSAISNRTSPCAPPLGPWRGDDWHLVDPTPALRASRDGDLIFVEFKVAIPSRADNWKIKLKITDPKGVVLETADTPLFNIR